MNRRKPFVAPQLREQASLAGVTLISGGTGNPTGRVRYKKRGYCGANTSYHSKGRGH